MADLLTPIPVTPADVAAQQQFEQSTAPARPQEYHLPWYGGRQGEIPDQELHALDQGLRSFAHDVGLPAHVGSGVLQQAVDDLRRFEALPDNAKEVYVAEQRALLGRLLPGVTTDQIIAGAEKVLAKADRQFVEDGRATGLFSSAALLVQLYVQSLRAEARGQR